MLEKNAHCDLYELLWWMVQCFIGKHNFHYYYITSGIMTRAVNCPIHVQLIQLIV